MTPESRLAAADPPIDRVWTIPNALSIARLLGVPLFLWLLLGPHADIAALVVLALSGISDYLDGKIARALGQTSQLGVLLDPAADRLYVLATLVAFAVRGLIPWWLVAILVGRDLILGLCLPVLRRHGYGPLQVHYLGKAATFNLLYAFPFLLLAEIVGGTAAQVIQPIAWAFTIWGTALYLWAGALYVWQVITLVGADRRGAPPAPETV
ncbi:MAG TPA: CDP-alcohol phosphatidyltransferase family protein [Mycobacteriales bacterium]